MTCSTDNARSWPFFSHLRCHVSIAEWDRPALLQNSYLQGRPDQTAGFQVMGPTFVRWRFSFLRPRSSGSQRDRMLKALPFQPYSPNDALITHRKSTPFPIPGLPRATSTSCIVSMGLGQRALTEVLVVPHWLPLPLVQGVFDRCFGFFRDLI